MAEETKMSQPIKVSVAKMTPTRGVKAPAPGREMDAFLKKAIKGDERCLPQALALLADPERGEITTEYCGSSAKWIIQAIANKASVGNVLVKEAIKKRISEVRAELEGPDPAPIESLLAERAAICWFIVNWYEDRFVNSVDASITQADYFQRRLDRAHRRFLSAVETLARIRKMALPALMLNIARNQQVNVAEKRT
jgi:hypothetical protein